MIFTTAATVAILIILGLMLWDQWPLPPYKWAIWLAMLAVLLGNTWLS